MGRFDYAIAGYVVAILTLAVLILVAVHAQWKYSPSHPRSYELEREPGPPRVGERVRFLVEQPDCDDPTRTIKVGELGTMRAVSRFRDEIEYMIEPDRFPRERCPINSFELWMIEVIP